MCPPLVSLGAGDIAVKKVGFKKKIPAFLELTLERREEPIGKIDN